MNVTELFAQFSSGIYTWDITLYDLNANTEIHTNIDDLDSIDEAWLTAEIYDWTCDGESFTINVVK